MLSPATSASRTSRWFAITMVVVVVLGLSLGLAGQLQAIERSVRITMQTDVDYVEQVLAAKAAEAFAMATLLAQDPTMIEPLEQRDRAALLARFEEPFEELRREHGIAHLHFAIPPATSLLRVHAPDLYGDDLTPYRPMLVAAMESGTPLAGFERGRMGASARATVPVLSSEAPDSWAPAAGDNRRVVGLVDLGYSLDSALLSDALGGIAVALVTLPSDAVTAEVGREDQPVTVSTLPPEVGLVVDSPAESLALIDGDLDALIPHDRTQWRLSRRVLNDHLGAPAAVLVVASDVSDAQTTRSLAHLTTALTALLLLVSGVVLLVLRRSARRQLEVAATSILRSGQLGRALRMADTEEASLRVLDRALNQIVTEGASRLLLADSSRAHLKVAIDHGFDDAQDALPTPGRCPATRSGEIQRFNDLDAIDVCPFLLSGACASGYEGGLRCQPMTIRGATVGVLQAQAAQGSFPEHVEHQLDDLVRQAGDHLTQVRAQVEASHQAATDPLTGLANRRHFDREVGRRLEDTPAYAVLYADLDHFKRLNDSHGHDVGDRALRLFAGVLRSSLRPDDIISRFGGEEFVIFLPGCDRHQAREAAERVREELVLALASGTVPSFTVSIGVADRTVTNERHPAAGLDAVLAAADAALLQAKDAGRDRVVVQADNPASAIGTRPDTPEPTAGSDERSHAAQPDRSAPTQRRGPDLAHNDHPAQDHDDHPAPARV